MTGSVEGNNMDHTTYNQALEIIKTNIFKKYKKVLFLCSGDLSHIGQKFNDKYDALDEVKNLKQFEYNLIQLIERYEIDSFYNYLNENNKKWKVCGFAPFYAGMKLADKTKGNILNHSIWYERPKKSLVSFMSMIFE
jgi:AmmeMemoRadiSam system protein B